MNALVLCLVLCLTLNADNHIESPDDDIHDDVHKSWKLYVEADGIMSSLQLFKLDEINRPKYLDKQNTAITLFEEAATMPGNGSAPAYFALASIFSGSIGVPNDNDPRFHDDRAFKYFQQAANKGNVSVFKARASCDNRDVLRLPGD